MTQSYNSLAIKKYLILLAILSVGVLLRSIHMGDGFTQTDELNDVYNVLNFAGISPLKWIDPHSYTNQLYHGPLYAALIAFVANIVFLPLLYYLNVPVPINIDILRWEHTTGVYIIEPIFRTVPVIFGIITIFLVFKLGKEFDEKTGLIAAFILTISSWHIYITHLISPHGAISMMTLLSIFLFYKGVKNEDKCLITYASITAGLAIYMNILSLVIPVICVLYLFILKRNILKTLGSAVKVYCLILFIPTLTAVAMGGKWFLAQIKGAVLGASYEPANEWMIVWDPIRGIFQSGEHPLIYWDIFLEYLSLPLLILSAIGLIYSISRVIYHRDDKYILILTYFFIPFILLNTLVAKTPRYPAIILPAIAIFSAIAVVWITRISSRIWKRGKYPIMCAMLTLVLLSQPHLYTLISERYVIAVEEASTVYDPLVAADYINPKITPDDIVLFGGIKLFPWWYIKGNLTPDESLDFSIESRTTNPKYIIIDQIRKELVGTGGGPIWLSGNYGGGEIILVLFNITEKPNYIIRIIGNSSRIGVISHDTTLSDTLIRSGLSADNFNSEFPVDISRYDFIVIDKLNEADRQLLKEHEKVIFLFLENGGRILILNPDVRFIDFLPLKTKAVQIKYISSHFPHIPNDKIFFKGNLSEDITWSGFFYDYNKEYQEIAFSSPAGLFLYENYNLVNVTRDPHTGWPLMDIYERK